jgi:hypothetical protein
MINEKKANENKLEKLQKKRTHLFKINREYNHTNITDE